MQYLGSKARVSEQIAAFLESERERDQTYIEPFLGKGTILMRMSGKREGSDFHPDLILMWKAIQNGWTPPDSVSESEYAELRNAAPSATRGYVGFQCSFGGKWFGGYARDPKSQSATMPRTDTGLSSGRDLG